MITTRNLDQLDAQIVELENALADLRAERTALRAQRLSELRDELARLEAEEAAPAKRPRRKPAPVEAVEAVEAPGPQPAEPNHAPVEAVACRYCGKECRPAGVRVHEARCSKRPPPVVYEELEETPVVVSHDELLARQATRAWRCAVCGSSAFAPSVADPDRCIRCEAAQRNGHTEEVVA